MTHFTIKMVDGVRGGIEDTMLEAKTKAKDTKNPRPRTALSRTDSLGAKDRNAQGQGPRKQPEVFSKKSLQKKFFRRFPIH